MPCEYDGDMAYEFAEAPFLHVTVIPESLSLVIGTYCPFHDLTAAEQEEAVDELDIDYGGDAIEIGFNVTYLIDALANMEQDMVKLELADANSSALFTIPENSTFKYVVMPMRI